MSKKKRSPVTVVPTLVAIIAVGIAATMAIVTACLLTTCDPILTVPSTVVIGSDLVVTGSSDNPPVELQATWNNIHLPGSPDNGTNDPSDMNTGSFTTVGPGLAIQHGDLITVTATSATGESVTKTVKAVTQ